jgi:hypothetical protein
MSPPPSVAPRPAADGETTAPGTRSPIAGCSDAIGRLRRPEHQTLTSQALDGSPHPKDPAIKINIVPGKGQ